MAGWVASLSASLWSNWKICVRTAWFGTGAPRGNGVRDDDDLFIWRAHHGLVASCLVTGDAERVGPQSSVPWPDRDKYRYVWPISQIMTASEPVETNWTRLARMAGLGRIPASQLPPVNDAGCDRLRGLFGLGQAPTSTALDVAWTEAVGVDGLDEDQRERSMRAIAVRRGQPTFRESLLEAYRRSCAVTGTAVEEVLEAAHIRPYLGGQTQRVDNGLLLRADIHTLFDLYRLTVLTSGGVVSVDPALRGTDYGQLDGVRARLPEGSGERPHEAFLRWHNDKCSWAPSRLGGASGDST